MKQLICANEATYEVCNETVCYPSGDINVRSFVEIWMPEKAMTFNQFEALCKNTDAMQHITVKSPNRINRMSILRLCSQATPCRWKSPKKLHQTYDASTGETISETRLFARMEQLTFIERKLAELGADVRWR